MTRTTRLMGALAMALSFATALPAHAGWKSVAVGVGVAKSADVLVEAGKAAMQARQAAQAQQGQTVDRSQGCERQLPHGRAPAFANPAWNTGLTTLCFQEFAVAVSNKTRTALWSAEWLTRERLEAARQLPRVNSFHVETALPPDAQASLEDYKPTSSTLDRGHLSPNFDMSTPSSQHESFSLANIVPQEAYNNRYTWASIESGTRQHVYKNGPMNVITGPLYLDNPTPFLRVNRVAVPSHLWKLVYDPNARVGGVYMVKNEAKPEVLWHTVADFERLSGYRFNLGVVGAMPMPRLVSRSQQD